MPVVVAINRFATDTDAELELVRAEALAAGADDAQVRRCLRQARPELPWHAGRCLTAQQHR